LINELTAKFGEPPMDRLASGLTSSHLLIEQLPENNVVDGVLIIETGEVDGL